MTGWQFPNGPRETGRQRGSNLFIYNGLIRCRRAAVVVRDGRGPSHAEDEKARLKDDDRDPEADGGLDVHVPLPPPYVPHAAAAEQRQGRKYAHCQHPPERELSIRDFDLRTIDRGTNVDPLQRIIEVMENVQEERQIARRPTAHLESAAGSHVQLIRHSDRVADHSFAGGKHDYLLFALARRQGDRKRSGDVVAGLARLA